MVRAMGDSRNLRMLRDSNYPLGVMCNACLHRSLVAFDALSRRHGLMRKLADLRFTCTRCGRHDVSLEMFHHRGDVTRFLRRD